MKLKKLSTGRLTKLVRSTFGKSALWDRRDAYCFVHLDGPDDKLRAERLEAFVPSLFFDPHCPCCEPFLKDGAFMVFDGDSIVGLRPLGNGSFESVVLSAQEAMN